MPVILVENWWAVALRGAAAVLFGLAAIIWPAITLAILIALFGAFALVDGLFSLVGGLAGEGTQGKRWPLVLEGAVGIAIGLLTFFYPGTTALVLLILIAAWAILIGALRVYAAIELRKVITGEWMLALSGALTILFGLLLLAFPQQGALAVVYLIGAFALVLGALELVLGFSLRRWSESGDIEQLRRVA